MVLPVDLSELCLLGLCIAGWFSLLAEESDGLDEVGREEEAAHEGVAAVELEGEQVDALRLVAWLVGKEDLHLVLVVRSSLELPARDDESL